MVYNKENYKFDLGVKGLICHHKIAQRVDLHMLKLKTLPDCQIEPLQTMAHEKLLRSEWKRHSKSPKLF